VQGVSDVYIAPRLNEDDTAYPHVLTIQEDPYRLPDRWYHFDAYVQDAQKIQGKLLRIDVDNGHPGYAIPATNLFKGRPEGRNEIYAWRLRNPLHLSFDRAGNGDMLVNGVAESLWDTIHLIQGSGNYGWAVREGTHSFSRKRAFDPPNKCTRYDALGARMHDPIVEYANSSITRPWSRSTPSQSVPQMSLA